MREMTNAAVLRLALMGLCAGLAIATIAVTGQQPETLSITEVKDGLYYVNGVGGNVGVRVTSEGVILIDDKYPRNVDGIREQVRSVTNQPIRYVVNTHHHGDHAGGNPGFIDEAEIVAHENVRENMIRGGQEAPPRIVSADRTGIHLGGVEVQAHHFGRGTHQRRLGRLLPRPADDPWRRPAPWHCSVHRLRERREQQGVDWRHRRHAVARLQHRHPRAWRRDDARRRRGVPRSVHRRARTDAHADRGRSAEGGRRGADRDAGAELDPGGERTVHAPQHPRLLR